jgi:amino acid permease
MKFTFLLVVGIVYPASSLLAHHHAALHTSHAALRPRAATAIRRPRIVKCNAAVVSWYDSGGRLTPGDGAGAEDDADKSSFTATVFNTCKAALGAGVLALPAGVAKMGDTPAALWPASGLILGLGLISAYSFSLTARMCDANDAASLGDAWKAAIGKKSAWIVPASLAALTLGVCVAYAIILGDTFSSVAVTAGLKGFAASRHASILLCAVALLPLCMLTSLSALAPSSIIGVLGVFVTGGFIGLRLKQGAYAAGGALAAAVAPELRPVFGATGMRPLFPSSLVLISMVATAYQAHFSAPAFYNALEGKSIAKFNQVTAISFGIIAAVTVAMTAWGFLTFGGACSGLVLNNYATMDAGATLSRLLMGFAILGAYPLCFAAAREALFELYPRLIPARTAFTRLMHAILTVGGLLIADVGFVVSFIGAVLGSAIIYIFPALLFLATSRAREANGAAPTSLVKAERWGCRGMAALGIVLGVLGGAVSIISAFF